MKILFLLTQDLESPSGLGRYWPLARELAVLGHHICILALHADFDNLKTKKLVKDNVDIHYVGQMHVKKSNSNKEYFTTLELLKITALGTWKILRAALGIPCDVVYIGKPHPMNSIAGLVVKALRRRKAVLDCDDFEADSNKFAAAWQKQVLQLFENNTPKLVDAITTNTHFMVSYLSNLGISKNKILYLPNGVDWQRFGEVDTTRVESLKKALGIENQKIILYMGSLGLSAHPINLLLEAFVTVANKFSNARLLIVGGGEDYDNLLELAAQLSIEEKVIFTGRVPPDQAVYYYRLAQVSTDPVYDNLAAKGRCPLKLFESWACEVPFITSDVGDRKLLLGFPQSGLTVRPGDATALAEGIIQLLTTPSLCESVRKQGLKRLDSYKWDMLARRLETFFSSLNNV